MATMTISSLIEFLLALLGDEDLQDEFLDDPEGTLARYGLDSACGEDIRDARPMVADQVGVQSTGGHQHFADSDDAAPEITLITKHFEVDKSVDDSDEYNYYYIDNSDDTIITVDDRDTVHIEADGNVTITDSFNEDNDITVIEDSFNEDNDGIDNKGGEIDDSVAAGDDIDSSLNSDDDTTVSDSENTTVTETNTDESSDTTAEQSFNDNSTSDDDGADVDIHIYDVGDDEQTAAPTAVHEADSALPAEDADESAELDEATVSG